jgi:hypothetical protein
MHALTIRLDLIHIRLDLIHIRLDLVHIRLDLIHIRLDLIHIQLDLVQVNNLIKYNQRVWPRVRTRALFAPAYLGSKTCKNSAYAPLDPVRRSFAASL